MPMTGSGATCQRCRWASGAKIIAQVQFSILCNFNLCVKHSALFNTRQTLVEDREMIASLKKSWPSRRKMLRIRARNENVRSIFDVKVV